RIGRYPWQHELALLERLRTTLPSIELIADAGGTYSRETALAMGQALEALDFAWFEEPTPQLPAYDGYEELAASLRIPVAGGEMLESRADFHELLSRRAVDIVQPDATLCGGIGEA